MARKPDTPCAGGCGTLLWGGTSSLPAGERRCRPCRRGTREAREAANPRPTWESRLRAITTCPVCGVEFRPRHTPQRACSRKCGFVLLHRERAEANWAGKSSPVPWAECQGCGRWFVGRTRTITCSDACAQECDRKYARRKWLATAKPTHEFQCARCGKTTLSAPTPGRPGPRFTRFCSSDCADKASHTTARARRRQRIKSGRVERFTIRDIAARDGWDCHLCGEPTDLDADPMRGDWAPSIDHIIPVAEDGEHVLDNVAIAHRWCNAARCTATVDEARALLMGVPGGVDCPSDSVPDRPVVWHTPPERGTPSRARAV